VHNAIHKNLIPEMHVTDSDTNDGFAKAASAGERLPAKSVRLVGDVIPLREGLVEPASSLGSVSGWRWRNYARTARNNGETERFSSKQPRENKISH